MAESIEVDYDANTAVANAHRQHASDLRQAGDTFAAQLTESYNQLGDLYWEAREAGKNALVSAMHSAHYRLANYHDTFAQSVQTTSQIFQGADEEGAAGLGTVMD